MVVVYLVYASGSSSPFTYSGVKQLLDGAYWPNHIMDSASGTAGLGFATNEYAVRNREMALHVTYTRSSSEDTQGSQYITI